MADGAPADPLRPEAVVGAAASGVALVLLAGLLYVVKPSLATWRRLGEERAQAVQEVDAAAARAAGAELQALAVEVEELRDQLYGGASEVPAEQLEAWVIDALDRISARHRIDLTSVKPGRPSPVLTFDELPYDVELAGRYFHLFDWLQDVERELRPMVVKEFAMERGQGSDPVVMRLRLVAYRSQGAGP